MLSFRRVLTSLLPFGLVAASAVAQAPVVGAGECLYLYGAPAGEPAAATEEFRSGTHVYDGCTYPVAAQVGRDEPHRLTIDMAFAAGEIYPRGCTATAWSEHEFRIEAAERVRVIASASGQWSGYLDGNEGPAALPMEAWLVVSAVELLPDGTERVLESVEVARHAVDTQQLAIDESWGRSIHFELAEAARIAIRTQLWVRAPGRMTLADFGSIGSGHGVSYREVEVCTMPVGTPGGIDVSELERDLHDKRCLPSIWMPESAGGRLGAATTFVADLITAAESTGDPGANVGMAQQRHDRAVGETARGEYQRACRSLSDAVRALTTP